LLLLRCINSKRSRLGLPANFQQMQVEWARAVGAMLRGTGGRYSC
jgi:hypothetical protein